MKVISLANFKGGSGKTSTALCLAQINANKGNRTLLIDLDPQCNLSELAGATGGKYSSYDMLQGVPAIKCIQRVSPGLDIIPGNESLSTLKAAAGSARRLQKAIAPVKSLYSLVLIDTPPTAGEQVYNALQASNEVLIPANADIMHYKGLYKLINVIELMKSTNPALTVAGVIITRYNGRNSLAPAMVDNFEKACNALDIPFLGTIRESVSVQKAQMLQADLFEYVPRSNSALDYLRLYESLEV